jgi:hypothetical protein
VWRGHAIFQQRLMKFELASSEESDRFLRWVGACAGSAE